MKPGLLIASPQMRDPNFARTVILLCHHDREGALGLVINRMTNLSIRELLERIDVDTREGGDDQVLWGGPVEQGAGFVVFDGRIEGEAGWNLPGHLAVSPSRQHLQEAIVEGSPYVLCLGYAGWGAGQLDSEIAAGSWLYTEIEPELVLASPVDERYDDALRSLGLTADQVWMMPIDE